MVTIHQLLSYLLGSCPVVGLGFLSPPACGDHSVLPVSSVLSLSIWTSEVSDEFPTVGQEGFAGAS